MHSVTTGFSSSFIATAKSPENIYVAELYCYWSPKYIPEITPVHV